jgi:antitoxin ParD1/3/4
MQTMNITLPDALSEYVQEQVRNGGYSNPSEYFRELVRGDQKRRAKEALEETLLAALAEGEVVEATPEWWDTLREDVRRRAAKRPRPDERD